MRTKPRRKPNRPVVVLATAAVVLASGCGVPTVQQYSSPTSSSAPRPTLKYSLDAFMTCAEIQQKVSDLPPPLPSKVSKSEGRLGSTCEFMTSTDGGPYITFQIQTYGNLEDSTGFHSGTEIAKSGFNSTVLPGEEKETKVNLGSEARWLEAGVGMNESCRLQVLDENAAMRFTYNPGKKDNNARSEQCRESARDVTKKVFATVQPQ